MVESVKIEWQPGHEVDGRLASGREGAPAVLLAHGAGAGQDHPGVAGLRDRLAAAGITTLTFNYPYTQVGRRRPDRAPTLLACHRAVLDWFQTKTGRPVVLAGRSMGGRMATYLAADGVPCRSLVLFAYPLHPAGKPERLRADHLSSVPVPMLFFTGSRDSMARIDLVDRHLRSLPLATVEIIEDADHLFRVPKRSGRTSEEVLDGIAARTAEWLGEQR